MTVRAISIQQTVVGNANHHNHRGAIWTAEMEDRLRALLGEGRSMREAVLALGVTRNAVIGKAHRLKLAQGRPVDVSWTEEHTESLRTMLLSEKITPAEAAARLGVSRSAVINKANRLGIKPRDIRPTRPRLVREISGLPLFSRSARILAFAPPSLSVSIVDVGLRQCRFIARDDHTCCGHETHKDTPWCLYHNRVVYRARPQQ